MYLYLLYICNFILQFLTKNSFPGQKVLITVVFYLTAHTYTKVCSCCKGESWSKVKTSHIKLEITLFIKIKCFILHKKLLVYLISGWVRRDTMSTREEVPRVCLDQNMLALPPVKFLHLSTHLCNRIDVIFYHFFLVPIISTTFFIPFNKARDSECLEHYRLLMVCTINALCSVSPKTKGTI